MANLTMQDDFRCERCGKAPNPDNHETYIVFDVFQYKRCCVKCNRELKAEANITPGRIVEAMNIPPIPPVQRARLSRVGVLWHTIRIFWLLRVQRLKLGILEWLGVDQLIGNEVKARKANDDYSLNLLHRQASQMNMVVRQMPALVQAKKRLEFYENDEILRHALKRFNKANLPLTLEKKDAGTQADGQAHDHRGRAGTVGEVSKGPRPDAAVEDGQAGVRRPDADGALEGRPEVPGKPSAEILTGLRDPFIADLIMIDEATTFTEAMIERRLQLEEADRVDRDIDQREDRL